MKRAPNCEMFIDGASRGNPGPAGIGVVCMEHTSPKWQLSEPIGITTNNVAEYTALIYALQEASKRGYHDVLVKTDSELLTRQMSGQYRVKNAALKPLYALATHLRESFHSCAISHIPRALNHLADRLAGQAADRHVL